MPARQGCLDRTGGREGPRRPDSPPPLWLVWMPEQPCLGPGNKSGGPGGRRPHEAGHVPPPPPHGLGSLAASSVFPRGEIWFSPGTGAAEGKSEPASSLVEPGGRALQAVLGAQSLPSHQNGCFQKESCQVTCRGSMSQRPPPSLDPGGVQAGRPAAASGQGAATSWPGLGVCTSCCRQLAEAVLPTPTGVGAEERTPCWALPLPPSRRALDPEGPR